MFMRHTPPTPRFYTILVRLISGLQNSPNFLKRTNKLYKPEGLLQNLIAILRKPNEYDSDDEKLCDI